MPRRKRTVDNVLRIEDNRPSALRGARRYYQEINNALDEIDDDEERKRELRERAKSHSYRNER